jgi:hypothetical protein
MRRALTMQQAKVWRRDVRQLCPWMCERPHDASPKDALTISLLDVPCSILGKKLESCTDWPSSETATRVTMIASEKSEVSQEICVTV